MSAATADQHAEAQDHHEHHDPFWKKYIFSTDHKVIGLQYGFTALIFLAFGFFLMMVMRWSIAYPDRAVPVLSDWPWFQAWLDDGGVPRAVDADRDLMRRHVAPPEVPR